MSSKVVTTVLAVSMMCLCASAVQAEGRNEREARHERRHDIRDHAHRDQHRELRSHSRSSRDGHARRDRGRQDHQRHEQRRYEYQDRHRPSRDWDDRRHAYREHHYDDRRRHVVRDFDRRHQSSVVVYRHYDRPRYRIARYEPPYGYRAHHWHRGARLPVAYCAPRYIVHDYHSFGLRHPPYGYRWVRVDSDVVLAAITTGIVLEVVDQIFW